MSSPDSRGGGPTRPQVAQQGESSSADVVIVGAGPVGLTLAILLAQRGRSVVVFERWPEPYRLPRAVHFDDEVGRLLQSCGIGRELRAISEPAEVYEWRNAAGRTLLRFGRIGTGPSGWPVSSMFNQPQLEALLERRADSLGSIDIRRGVEVVSLTQTSTQVEVVCADGHTSAARYVVGCDGANSTVRSLLDIDVVDRGFFYDWLIVDVVLNEPRVFDPVNLQVCDPARPTTAVSGGPGRRRWEFMRLPHESIDSLNRQTRAWELLEPWDVRPDNARLERHAVYTFQAKVAASWRRGRVLLAGDAAHLMPPFAGQGMCAGIRDAANLAWKLDLVLGPAAPEAVLDTYEQERKAGAEFAVDFSIELGKVICVPDIEQAAARDEAMAAGVRDGLAEVPGMPGLGAGLIAADSPAAGEQFPQSAIGESCFDDVYGAGWRLVHCGAGGEPDPTSLLAHRAGVAAWFASIGGAVVEVADSPTLVEWFERRGASWALQRPDFYVYGTACDDADALVLLERLRGHITASSDGAVGSAP